jgi:hypothetical protein
VGGLHVDDFPKKLGERICKWYRYRLESLVNPLAKEFGEATHMLRVNRGHRMLVDLASAAAFFTLSISLEFNSLILSFVLLFSRSLLFGASTI